MNDDDIEKIMDKGSFGAKLEEKSILKPNIRVRVVHLFMCPQCAKPDWLQERDMNKDGQCRFCSLIIPKECFVW